MYPGWQVNAAENEVENVFEDSAKEEFEKPKLLKANVWETTGFERERLENFWILKESAGEAKGLEKKSLRDLGGKSFHFPLSDTCARIS